MSEQDTEHQNTVPAWGSYLYQNFLLPALSPNIATDWLTSNSPFANNNNTQPVDYFNYGKDQYQAPEQPRPVQQTQPQWSMNATAGPSTYYQQNPYQSTVSTSTKCPRVSSGTA
jgi:hypothetical protein